MPTLILIKNGLKSYLLPPVTCNANCFVIKHLILHLLSYRITDISNNSSPVTILF
jgi:hypothetical protein